jgi:hypothetical protein
LRGALATKQSILSLLERFQAKWKPVRVKKTRQIKNLEPRFDSIETEEALGEMDCFAEPVIGRAFAPTRWLAKMVWTAPDGISVPDWWC